MSEVINELNRLIDSLLMVEPHDGCVNLKRLKSRANELYQEYINKMLAEGFLISEIKLPSEVVLLGKNIDALEDMIKYYSPKVLAPGSTREQGIEKTKALSQGFEVLKNEIQNRREERYSQMIDGLSPVESPMSRVSSK